MYKLLNFKKNQTFLNKNMIKKLSLVLLLVSTSFLIQAQEVNSKSLSKIFTDTTVSVNNKKQVKYYFIHEDKLVSTNKTAYNQVQLANKFGLSVELVYQKDKLILKR